MNRPDAAKMGSERSFGIVFSLIGGWQLWAGRAWAAWWLAGSAAFLALAVLAPWVLAPLSWLWFQLGLLLHRIVNPIVLGILFFAVVLPITEGSTQVTTDEIASQFAKDMDFAEGVEAHNKYRSLVTKYLNLLNDTKDRPLMQREILGKIMQLDEKNDIAKRLEGISIMSMKLDKSGNIAEV